MNHSVSVNERDLTSPTSVRYWVLGIVCAAAAIGYIHRYAISFLAEPIQSDLALDKDEMGSVMAGFFAFYALLSLPAGALADRYGTRRMLSLYAVVWSAATAGMALAWNQPSMIVVWALVGAAQAGLFPCAVIGLRQWLPATQRALASGMLASFMNIGAALAPLAAGAMVDRLGMSWRETFAVLALPGVAWGIGFYLWYRDHPRDHRAVNAAELRWITAGEPRHVGRPSAPKPRAPWRRLATSWRMWLMCAQHFLRSGAQVFFGTWFATFLRESPGIESDDVAWITSLPPLVLIVGSTFGGTLSDWLLRRTGSRRVSRQWLSVVNLALCAAMYACAALVEDSWLRVAFICTACLWMAIGGVSAYTITMDLGGPYVATVFGTMNMFGSFGAAAFPKYVGWLVNTTGNWNYVLSSVVVIYIAATICWMFLNPEGSLFDANEKGVDENGISEKDDNDPDRGASEKPAENAS